MQCNARFPRCPFLERYVMFIPFEWEVLNDFETMRAKVIGGWIVRRADSFVFIPDQYHTWEVEPSIR